MRPTLLAACLLAAAAPAWGQEKTSEDPRAEMIDELMEGVSIIRCDDDGRPLYLPFTKDAEDNDALSAWYLDGDVSFVGDYAVVQEKKRMLMISKTRMIVITEKTVQEFPCQNEKLAMQALFLELRRRSR